MQYFIALKKANIKHHYKSTTLLLTIWHSKQISLQCLCRPHINTALQVTAIISTSKHVSAIRQR